MDRPCGMITNQRRPYAVSRTDLQHSTVPSFPQRLTNRPLCLTVLEFTNGCGVPALVCKRTGKSSYSGIKAIPHVGIGETRLLLGFHCIRLFRDWITILNTFRGCKSI